MKIQSSKRTLILVLVIFVALALVIFILLLTGQLGKNYPEQPVGIKNLGVTKQNIDMSDVKKADIKNSDIPMYVVEKKVHISDIERFISDLELTVTRQDVVKDSYIEWSDKKNKFTYDSITDTLDFQIVEDIYLQRGKDAFSGLFSKYFDRDYKFVVNLEKKNSSGGLTYYASRLLSEIPVEDGYGYEYSDILNFDSNGRLISGKILLAETTKLDTEVPLISDSLLNQFINSSNYPKEVYLETSVLQNTLDLDYLDSDWGEIEKTLSDCKGTEKKVIYLYKNTEQEFLLPVYKIDSICSVKYENNVYSIPATFYANGVDTDYVAVGK